MKDLEEYMEVSDTLEDDLVAVEDARLLGTCEWTDSEPDAPSILWINGKPAAGKSIYAGHAINQLRRRNTVCIPFFFKYRDKSKSLFNACLRSLASLMAIVN